MQVAFETPRPNMELSAQAIGLRSKFTEGLTFERPSSCPPVQRHQRDVSVGEAPTVAPSDVRLTKSYYDYYYSFSHSRNPRLPKPLIDWSHQDGSDGAPGGGIGGGPAGIGGGHGPGIGGGHGLGMGESAFPRMGSAGTGMGSKQALYRRSNPRSPHGDYPSAGVSGDSPPGPRGGGAGALGRSPSSGGGSVPVGAGGNSPVSAGPSGGVGNSGSEHSADSQISPRFGSMPPNGAQQALRRPFLDEADSLDAPFSKLSLSSSGDGSQFDRPGSYNNFSSYPPGPVTLPGGATPTGGAGPDGFHAHHHKAAPASLSSVGTGSSADGSAGLGPQPGPAGASAASPPFVPQNAVGGPGYPPHMHGGPLMSPPAGGNPLRTPGSGTAAGGFWSADSPAADIPLGNASTAELMQQLAMRTAAAGGGGGGFDDRGAFSPQFGSPTAAGYGAAGFVSPKNRFNRQGSAGPLTPTSAGAAAGASLQSLLIKGNNSKIDTRYLSRQKFNLMDIVRQDLVRTFSKDQHGSRLIQQKIQKASPQEQDAAFQQVEPAVLDLCLDIYGNYVVQKYFEHGQDRHKAVLMQHMSGHILELSVDVFGCRVVQKALENVESRTRLAILKELSVSVHRCVLDQNANHVLQKCIQVVESQHLDPIIDCFQQNVKQYCMHSYGCRIMQRLLTYCTFAQTKRLLDEISKHALDLSANEYGNYVVQHVLKNGAPEYKKQVIDALIGHVLGLSRHKFASNVIEKCFEHGTAEQVQKLIMEISDNDCIAIMVGDQYANYVVQKILGFCNVEQKVRVLKKIMEIPNFHKVAFGKHIIFAVDKLRASLRDRLNLEFDEHPENVAAFNSMHK